VDDNKDKAYRDYQSGMKYKDIAEKYGVSLNTVKSWKKRYKWIREKGAHKKERVHTKGAPIGNQNAAGHGAPTGNQNATKFGFFSKYLPAESVEIMQEINTADPSDLLWDQIMIQYTAIIRAQKIMMVRDHEDTTKMQNMYLHSKSKKETKTTTTESSTDQEGYLIQFAWDKQANFLNAQSRAMGELRALIKQFVAIADDQDERRKKLELMQAHIDAIKSDIKRKDNTPDKPDISSYIDALKGKASEVWNHEED
jgi:uncharacterized protein YjcR